MKNHSRQEQPFWFRTEGQPSPHSCCRSCRQQAWTGKHEKGDTRNTIISQYTIPYGCLILKQNGLLLRGQPCNLMLSYSVPICGEGGQISFSVLKARVLQSLKCLPSRRFTPNTIPGSIFKQKKPTLTQQQTLPYYRITKDVGKVFGFISDVFSHITNPPT